jgi:hypothetical protein
MTALLSNPMPRLDLVHDTDGLRGLVIQEAAVRGVELF